MSGCWVPRPVPNLNSSWENDLDLIAPLQDLAQRMIGSMDLCDAAGCLQVGVALQHAVMNAMYHGNLELSPG